MVKFMDKKRKEQEKAAVSRQEKGKQSQETHNSQKVYTEEGLFDIAYANYLRTYPESNMKRRDFRRQIWGTGEMVSYLDKELYGKYLEIMNGEEIAEPSDREFTHEEVSFAEEVREQEEESTNIGPIDPLDPLDVLKDFDRDIIPEQDVFLESPIGKDAADLEPVYDVSFLDGYPDAHFLDEVQADEKQTEAEIPETVTEDDFIAGEMGEDLTAEAGELEEGLREDMPENCPCDNETAELEDVDEEPTPGDLEKKDVACSWSDQKAMPDFGHGKQEKEEQVTAKEITTDSAVLDGVTLPGIFGKPGIMEKLRRSVFLDGSDNHMDDELLQLTDVEVFEQLIRLEGCVRKVPQISQIAQLVFGEKGAATDESLPSQERLVDIVNAAAGFIAFVSHTDDSDSDEMLNDMISQSLGLTEGECRMGFVEKQTARKSYVVYYSDHDSDDLLNVYGNYTDVCRAVFMFEQAYEIHGVRDLRAFLNMLGLQWTADETDQDMIDADIQIMEGRVILV